MRISDAEIEEQWVQAPLRHLFVEGWIEMDRLGVYVTVEYSALISEWLRGVCPARVTPEEA